MQFRILHLFCFLSLLERTFSWIFEATGPTGKEIIDIAFWNNRAFLCMADKVVPKPGKIRSNTTSGIKRINYLGAAIFEAPWPENASQSWGLKALKIEDQELENECMQLKAAVAIDIDVRGRMFALLLGSQSCHPRIVVIDLVLNRQITRTELTNAPRLTLRSLVVDYLSTDTRVYIGGVRENLLLVFSFKEELWWRIQFTPSEDMPAVPTGHLALSKRDNTLYMTSSNSPFLFSVDTEELGGFEKEDGTFACSLNRTATPTLIGEKLGKSMGLLSDPRGGLIYSLIRDYAVVRWDSHYPLIAESHDVLLQSAELLPDVRHIFKDSQKNVWALNGVRNEEEFYCTRVLKLN